MTSPLDVAILGAGVSGLCMGIRLKRAGIPSFAIFEKSHDVGDTWRDSSDPGAGCDVPSQLYSFSFEPNPDWSRALSPQPEIRRYPRHCAEKYEIRPQIRFGTEIAKSAAQVTVFPRSTHWVIPRNGRRFSEADKARFRRHPLLLRAFIGSMFEIRFRAFLREGWFSRRMTRRATAYLHAQVSDPPTRSSSAPASRPPATSRRSRSKVSAAPRRTRA